MRPRTLPTKRPPQMTYEYEMPIVEIEEEIDLLESGRRQFVSNSTTVSKDENNGETKMKIYTFVGIFATVLVCIILLVAAVLGRKRLMRRIILTDPEGHVGSKGIVSISGGGDNSSTLSTATGNNVTDAYPNMIKSSAWFDSLERSVAAKLAGNDLFCNSTFSFNPRIEPDNSGSSPSLTDHGSISSATNKSHHHRYYKKHSQSSRTPSRVGFQDETSFARVYVPEDRNSVSVCSHIECGVRECNYKGKKKNEVSTEESADDEDYDDEGFVTDAQLNTSKTTTDEFDDDNFNGIDEKMFNGKRGAKEPKIVVTRQRDPAKSFRNYEPRNTDSMEKRSTCSAGSKSTIKAIIESYNYKDEVATLQRTLKVPREFKDQTLERKLQQQQPGKKSPDDCSEQQSEIYYDFPRKTTGSSLAGSSSSPPPLPARSKKPQAKKRSTQDDFMW